MFSNGGFQKRMVVHNVLDNVIYIFLLFHRRFGVCCWFGRKIMQTTYYTFKIMCHVYVRLLGFICVL